MDQFNNNQLGVGFEKNEMSLTMKYLLENPALLQPPETDKKEKCKDDNMKDICQSFDQPSAYLGPQIWDDLLLSDDLKLEPVSVDELLDLGTDDEFTDFNLLLSNKQNSQDMSPDELSGNDKSNPVSNYCDMPSLVSDESPEAIQIPSPSQFFHVPVKDTPNFNINSTPSSQNGDNSSVVLNGGGSPNEHQQDRYSPVSMHSSQHQVLCDQQAALLADIVCNQSPTNGFYGGEQYNQQAQYEVKADAQQPAPDSYIVSNPTSANSLTSSQMNDFVVNIDSCSSPSNRCIGPMADGKRNQEGLEKGQKHPSPSSASSPMAPLQIRIPSPVMVDFVVDQAGVIISTPIDSSGEKHHFDPTTRRFTRDELKPQPIIRKSRKVLVPPEGKDGKYWSRRTKNNAAAKRSREARRIKENQIFMRANFLEQENVSLKADVSQLRKELKRVMDIVKGYEKRFALLPKGT